MNPPPTGAKAPGPLVPPPPPLDDPEALAQRLVDARLPDDVRARVVGILGPLSDPSDLRNEIEDLEADVKRNEDVIDELRALVSRWEKAFDRMPDRLDDDPTPQEKTEYLVSVEAALGVMQEIYNEDTP